MPSRIIKLCRSCDEEKEHSVRATGTPFSWCLECQRAYAREHYRERAGEHNARRKLNKYGEHKAKKEFIQNSKDRPCTDCGVQYPYYVMQFDHVRGEKKFTIGAGIDMGWRSLTDEIAKCEVVCANCHMERTHGNRV